MMRFSIASPDLGKRQCRMLNAPARRPVETHKKLSCDNLHMSGSGL